MKEKCFKITAYKVKLINLGRRKKCQCGQDSAFILGLCKNNTRFYKVTYFISILYTEFIASSMHYISF